MRLSAGAGFVVAQNNGDLDEAIRLYTRAIQSREFNNRFLAITYYNRGNVQFVARDYLAQSPITTSPSAWRPISPRPITTAPMRNIWELYTIVPNGGGALALGILRLTTGRATLHDDTRYVFWRLTGEMDRLF